MSLRVRIAGVLAVTAALLGVPAGQAGAEPTPVKSAEVVQALALPAQPTDFVVLVDNSTSMTKGKRAEVVRSRLAELLDIMEPSDRLALFTFDSTVAVQYRGLVGAQSARQLATLPKARLGWSDQGAALEAGVAELARSGANSQAVVVMITDGRPDAGPGSDYQSEVGKAWSELIDNGNRLVGQRPIASYQLSLSAASDAAALSRVFPSTRLMKVSSASRQIAAIRTELDQLRAGRLLGAELQAPITVSWAGSFGSGSTGWVPITVTVTSPYAHVPVVLEHMRVAANGEMSAEVSGVPKVIELAPGETKQLDARIQFSGDGDLRQLGLSFSATVDSPWRPVLTASLGLHFEPTIVTVAGSTHGDGLERSLPTLITVGGLLGLSVIVWWLGAALITPRMRGELIFSRHGEVLARVGLHGRRQDLAGVPGGGALASLAGTVYGARPVRGTEREVRVDLVAGKNWSRGVIRDGHVIQMGDMEIAYSSELGAILRPVRVH